MDIVAKISILYVCGSSGYASDLSVCYNILQSDGNIHWYMFLRGLYLLLLLNSFALYETCSNMEFFLVHVFPSLD